MTPFFALTPLSRRGLTVIARVMAKMMSVPKRGKSHARLLKYECSLGDASGHIEVGLVKHQGVLTLTSQEWTIRASLAASEEGWVVVEGDGRGNQRAFEKWLVSKKLEYADTLVKG